MQVLQLLAADEEVEDVVPLAAHLQSGLDPVKIGALEELGALQASEQITLVLRFVGLAMELVEDPSLEQLLVRNTDLRRVVQLSPDPVTVPMSDQWNVDGAASSVGTHVERVRRSQQGDASRSVGRGQRRLRQERFQRRGRGDFVVLLPVAIALIVLRPNVLFLVVFVDFSNQWDEAVLLELVTAIVTPVLLLDPHDGVEG
mmetsp:Transcript_10676/g.30499  ORF Transcript_10676/g.30499 Transcript_10676/m.30499 type:complete len:201 (+) Transcript_10676:10494-11096(+)